MIEALDYLFASSYKKKGGENMANNRKSNSSTRPADRSSISGRFVTERYARAHKATTEHERIRKGK